MDVNENGNNYENLSDRNNKFYLYFTQIGKIILIDNQKYFRCETDGLTFPIKSKGNHRSQDTDIINKLGYFSIIPICEVNGKIIAYHIVELDKKAKSEFFIIQARVKQTIPSGAVHLVVSIKGYTNITIPVQTNQKLKMDNNQIYLCQGYRENDKINILNCALIPEIIETSISDSSSKKVEKTKIIEPDSNVDRYAEVVASNHNGVLIYIPASQIESTQWRPTADKKYKLVTQPDGIKIINAAPVNIDDTPKIDTPKTCQYCIYEVNSICSKSDSPLFSSIIAPDSTCIKCTV